jgi:hypothetical protein
VKDLGWVIWGWPEEDKLGDPYLLVFFYKKLVFKIALLQKI